MNPTKKTNYTLWKIQNNAVIITLHEIKITIRHKRLL